MDLIERLRAAIDETERVALAATPGPWRVDSEDYAEIIYGNDDMVSVVSGGRWGDEASVFDSTADAIHIARHDPASTLRRCAADRKILELHVPVILHAGHPLVPPVAGATRRVCRSCSPMVGSADDSWPCPTLLALAEAYGIEP